MAARRLSIPYRSRTAATGAGIWLAESNCLKTPVAVRSQMALIRRKYVEVFVCKLCKKLADTSEGRNFIETARGRQAEGSYFQLRKPGASWPVRATYSV
jgi:hypothetical protein